MKYKVLMTLMGLDIGGAETHVVELSKELKKQGYDIIVASNGGVYESAQCNEDDEILHAAEKDHPQGKTGHCPFSCQNPRLYLRHAEKETEIYICHLCTLGILHRDGAEISDKLGTESRCGQ